MAHPLWDSLLRFRGFVGDGGRALRYRSLVREQRRILLSRDRGKRIMGRLDSGVWRAGGLLLHRRILDHNAPTVRGTGRMTSTEVQSHKTAHHYQPQVWF